MDIIKKSMSISFLNSKLQYTVTMNNLDKLSDEKLIEKIRTDDKELYSHIIDRYEHQLRVYLSRITNYSNEVDDLVQETLIKTYINLHSFNIERKFSSWIYRIAHNLAINYMKKKKANISLDQDEILKNQIASKIDIVKEFKEKEITDILTEKINSLPEKFKEPFILKYFEDKSYDEISDILRIPKNTVGTFISRAKKILQKKLSKYYEK